MSSLTKKALRESIVRALNEKSLDKIRVKDLVEDCGVNRNTFYYHYKDIYELLADVFERERQALIDKAQDETIEDWQQIFIESAKFALENKKMIYNVYNSISRDMLERYLYSVSAHSVAKYVSQEARGIKVSDADKDLIILFYKHAAVGIVMEWLQRGMRDEPQTYINRICELMYDSVRNALKNAEKLKK